MFDPYCLFAPLLARLDAETSHRLAIGFLKTPLSKTLYPAGRDEPILAMALWGRTFANPIGVAAGFDKNAEVPEALLGLGCGFAEVGGVTLRPQPGNPRPRVFRLPEDRAVVNRMGFNNDGAEVVAGRLASYAARRGAIGVNIGINKDSIDPAGDFAAVARRLAPHADFLVVNVSSPNTPGLRALQNIGPLKEIVQAVQAARNSAAPTVPLLLKISPDLAREDVTAITDLALAEKLDGLVISNTTISRPSDLKSARRIETGGLSGRPLFAPSTEILAHVYRITGDALPLVGVGGVASGADAYAKIRAGASLVQLYTAMVYDGPALIGRIKSELAQLLKRDGYKSVAAAVGADHRHGPSRP
ncbi:MAG: quinone-dependent dihydroorotate dehydrogenase [Rhodospirillaceae bacterium]|nr:MAG: quinone-dependent dihydroorotate dehydrogenase [Rhodospirillaceae bacterium]